MLEGANYLEIPQPITKKKKSNKKTTQKTTQKTNQKTKAKNSSNNTGAGGSNRFHCNVCSKSYLRKRHLQRHVRDECIGIPPRFSCDLCPSRFRRKYHMVRHLTSKHGIPHAIAQQTTGNSNRNRYNRSSASSSSMQLKHENDSYNNGAADNGLPENLTMPKQNYESMPQPPPPLQYLNYHHHHLNGGGSGGSAASPRSYITSGDSGSDCNGLSPIPPPTSHIMTMPTYGLTGAITAISAAAAHVEEKDAKILLEAAAANGCINNSNTTTLSPGEDNENVAQNLIKIATTTRTTNSNFAANTAGNSSMNEVAFIKTEPLTPSHSGAMSSASAAVGASASMLDDDWKMKLSLQLISNSLLKERLMNSMPFAYKNN